MSGGMILILDFGGTQAQAIARKVRASKVYCEIAPCGLPLARIREKAPRGLMLVGGSAACAPHCDPGIFDMALPILAMGFAARLAVEALGGHAPEAVVENRALQLEFSDSPLFAGMVGGERYIDRLSALALPAGFAEIARCNGMTAAFASEERRVYGLQFFVESNDPDGLAILSNFTRGICGCEPNWSMEAFIERAAQTAREAVGDGEALMAVSGGVDSTVCAMLMQRAIGERMHCLYVDTGLMREGETREIRDLFARHAGIDLTCVDISERVLARLAGVCEPAQKRRIISEAFSDAFRQVIEERPAIRHIVQGTIYSDVISRDAGIAGNHLAADAGGVLPAGIGLIEPIRELFKDEVRHAGEIMGLPAKVVLRQSFPGPGLAIRMLGEVNAEKLAIIRSADAIFREEIEASGLDKRISFYFALLSDEGGQVVTLRALNWTGEMSISAYRLPYDLLERTCAKILAANPRVKRVAYDLTAGSSATIEWE